MNTQTDIQPKTDPKPVTDRENRKVNGEAIACKVVYEDHLKEVTELRQRKEAYEASLPKDPEIALQEILKIAVRDELDGPSAAAKASLEIIWQLVTHGALDEGEELKDALYWLTTQGLDGLKASKEDSTRIYDIAKRFSPLHRAYEA